MSTELDNLIHTIKSATQPGENTAVRVGTTLQLINSEKANKEETFTQSQVLALINQVKALAVTGTEFIGSITPDTPAVDIPDGDLWTFAGEGTYPDAGGIVVDLGEISILTRVDGVWSEVEIDIPVKSIDDIEKTSSAGLVDTYTITFTDGSTPTTFEVTNGKSITDWTASNYTEKSTVIKNGSIYYVADGQTTVDTEIPGISTKWILKISGSGILDIDKTFPKLGGGYYSKESARLAVPPYLRRNGLTIHYAVSSVQTITEKFNTEVTSQWELDSLWSMIVDDKELKKSEVSKFLLSDSVLHNYNLNSIIQFGKVNYVDNGDQLYINAIKKSSTLFQISNQNGTVVAQYYAPNVVSTGVEEISITNVGSSAGTVILFKCLVDWDKVKESDNLQQELHVNTKVNYTNSITSQSTGGGHRAGQTGVLLADSIGQFSTWTNIASQLTGANIINGAVGGSRMAIHQITPNDYDAVSAYNLAEAIVTGDWTRQEAAANYINANAGHDFRHVIADLKSLNWNLVNLIMLGFGTNDLTGGEAPIGSNTDNTGLTIKGAMNIFLSKVQTAYPKIEILVIPPIYRNIGGFGGESSDTWTNGLGIKMRDIIEAEEEICKLNHIDCLTLYDTLGINAKTLSQFTDDGTHLTPYGSNKYGLKVANKLS